MNFKYVQYGCGLHAPLTWRNFDVSPTLRLQRLPFIKSFFKSKRFPIWPDNVEYGDIVKGLPLAPNSCRAVYCSHVLEHLALEDFYVALQNTYRYLEPGGIFRLVLPDLEYLAKEYLDSDNAEAALIFMQKTGLGSKTGPRGLEGLLRVAFGNSGHLWMWDFKAIAYELEKVGFREIRRAKFCDSEELRFKDVENSGRWEKCLGVECVV